MIRAQELKRLNDALEKGFAAGDKCRAFDTLVVKKRSFVQTFCGLILGQKISFAIARSARKQFFYWMQLHHARYRSLFPVARDLVDLIMTYVNLQEVEIAAVLSLSGEEWSRWRIEPWAQERVRNAMLGWDLGATKPLSSQVAGIGPWTRKAFGLMCHGENLLLHEDSWIRKRWTELQFRLKIPQPIKLRDVERNPSLVTLPLWKLSFLLWRITTAGVSRLAAHQPLDRQAFIM